MDTKLYLRDFLHYVYFDNIIQSQSLVFERFLFIQLNVRLQYTLQQGILTGPFPQS